MSDVRAAWLVALSTLVGSACQQVSGVDDLQIVTPPKVHPDWSCIGAASARATSGTVSYTGVIREIGTDRIITDAELQFCVTSDTDCANPVLTTQTTSDGLAFTIDAGFNGYIQLTSNGMMPAIVELSRAIGTMRVLPELRMLSANTLNTFAFLMGAGIVAADGHALFWTEDCEGERSAGVQVSLLGEPLPETRLYYVIDEKLPSTTVDQTDASGGTGFINLPTRILTFEARRAENDQLISRASARIRAATTTFLVIEPD